MANNFLLDVVAELTTGGKATTKTFNKGTFDSKINEFNKLTKDISGTSLSFNPTTNSISSIEERISTISNSLQDTSSTPQIDFSNDNLTLGFQKFTPQGSKLSKTFLGGI